MAWLGDWANRVKLTLDHTKIDSDQIDFPVMLHISASSGIGDVDVSDVFDKLVSDANRKKIAVTTSGGVTQCYAEIERWDDANEQAWLWTKTPVLSSAADTVFYQYYDSTQPDNTTYIGDTGDTPAQSVWDSNFKLVMHMAQDPNGDVADAIKDSTGNANHGTPAGSMTSADLVDGKIGKAIDFDGVDDRIIISDSAALRGLGAITVEHLLNVDTKGDYDKVLDYSSSVSANTDRKYRLQFDSEADQGLVFVLWDDTNTEIGHTTLTAFPASSACYVTGVYTGVNAADSVKIYENGSLSNSGNGTGSAINNTSSGDLWLGVEQYLPPTTPYDGKQDEFRISNTARSAAWIKATYYSNWDELVSFEIEEEEVFQNLNTEIAADFLTNFADLLSDIRTVGESIIDLDSEIQAGNELLTDLNVDTEAKAQSLTDLLSDIRARDYRFHNLNTAIEAVRSKWWLKTEIKAGCAARWNFNTEWNPGRFLCTQITAKKPYNFSFKTQSAEGYAATEPTVEFKIPGYSFPLRTLFLDYIAVCGTNEYNLELWWSRGLVGKGGLKNAKIKAEFIDTSDAGGYEVVTCDWLSCKVNGGEYKTINTVPLLLGDIPCDSKLDLTLKVECRDCSLSRGLVFFKLIVTGDQFEPIYGGPIVYQDGSQYHTGLYDDFTSIDFISRLYIVE